jgi:hypothetical protein
MITRPLPITVVGWVLITFGVLGVLGIISSMAHKNPAVAEAMSSSPIPVPVQHAIALLGTAVRLLCGFYVLRGKNWARYLYVAWSLIGILIGLATAPMKLLVLPSLVTFLVIVFFLFQREANLFFASEGKALDPRSVPSNRRIAAVFFYVFAGFFFSCTGMGALMHFGGGIGKIMMLCFQILPVAICLAVGRRLSPGPGWKRDTGIVFIVGAAAGALFAVMMAAVFANPEFNKRMRPEHADMFRDYLFAVIWFAAWVVLGIALILTSRKDANRSRIPLPLAK